MRRFAPRADATLLPLAARCYGLGFVTISRLDLAAPTSTRVAPTQALWTRSGVAAFVADAACSCATVRTLARYRYTFLLLGVVALLLPLVPGIGVEINGARLWVRLGPLNGPARRGGEGAARRVLRRVPGRQARAAARPAAAASGRMYLPDPKHLGPLLLPWGVSILIMVQQKDLGSSLLFFAVFVAMLYIATDRSAYLVAGLVHVLGAAVVIAYQVFGHVQTRIDTWLDPWHDPQDDGLPARAEPVRVRQRRLPGHRPRARQPRRDPRRDDRLHLRRHR